jgi:hypothetical protein
MSEQTINTENMESIASRLIEKYPQGYLTDIEIGWPCGIAIRAPKDGLDTPVAFIYGSYQELCGFEHTYKRIKRAMPSQVLSSRGDQVYDVTATSCTCPGFHYRGHCKHVDAIRESMIAEA